MSETVVYRKRRNVELFGVILAALFGIGGLLLTHWNRDGGVSTEVLLICGGWLALCLVAHILVRVFISFADPVILPAVLALNGLGLAMIHRLDMSLATSGATTQLIWTLLGIAIFGLILGFMRDYRVLDGIPYVLFLIGMVMLLLPLIPGLGSEKFGSRIWIQVGSYSFQPAEVAKILLAISFASYLVEHRDLLTMAGPKIGKLQLPRLRDLLPILIMWATALVVLVFENDLGTSLLFFGLFIMMLYVATSQVRWLVISGGLFVAAAVVVSQLSHVQTRISSCLDPYSDFDVNYQVIQAQYGMAWGGLFGRGWGLGRPQMIPVASSDFISAAIGEELGIVGLIALIILYGLLISRGLKTALAMPDDFGKLLAAGFSFVFGLQTFAIIGGVTRLLPLTGLTTPFVSQGGSSLVCNWAIIAIIMVISHAARRPRTTEKAPIVADFADDRTQIIDVNEK